MTDKERIVAEITRLLTEWLYHASTEAKYRCEAYTELLEWIKAEPEETENGINQTQKEKR